MSQIRHSLDGTIISQKAVKHDFIGPSGRNQRKKLRSFTTFFMQNKPNLPEGKIDAKCVFKKDYENKSNWTLGENKLIQKHITMKPPQAPEKTNPIQTQCRNSSRSPSFLGCLFINRTKRKQSQKDFPDFFEKLPVMVLTNGYK